MPRQNLIVLLLVSVVSLLCYFRAARNRYAQTLTRAMNIVAENYIDEVEPRVLFEGAIDGMIGKLDPYSAYTSPEEFAQFQQTMDGEFTGIGIMVDVDTESGRLMVLEALVGKPAYQKGIRAGDILLEIDGQDTQGLALRDAVSWIRGKPGSKLKVVVQKAGQTESVAYELERATIPLESVMGDGKTEGGRWSFRLAHHPHIGYIRIVNFGERTGEEFHEGLEELRQDSPVQGLIIDLRYNAGGLLTGATEVCDALLDEGLIVTTLGRNKVLMARYPAKAGTDLPAGVPVVVLVDRLSASASEIVAACLQDHRRAAIVGQRTWGKGTVQNVVPLENGHSAIRLTVGSYHRPSGQEIHKWKDAKESDPWGVRPDPGLEVLLTNHQSELVVAARRKRDLLAWSELTSATPPAEPDPPASGHATPESPPVPTPQADEGQAAEQTPALEAEAAAKARLDPTTIDPQLRKALEHLQSQIDQDGSSTRAGRT
jgi:carboxyl-terminal processing protease